MEKLKLTVAIIFGILVMIGAFFYLNSLLDYFYLKKDCAYSISKTVFVGSTNSVSGTNSKYTFKVNNKWYQGFTSLGLHYDGTRYFIRFYPGNPNRNEATNIVADSTDIANLPLGGYKELPHH